MKELNQKTLGVNVLIKGVPSTAAEFDEMAGEVGACVDEATSNVVFRQWLARFRPAYIDAIAKETGIPPVSEEVDGKTKIVEKDTVYVKRLEAEGIDFAICQETAQRVADGMPFSLGSPAQGRIAKRFLEAAEDIVTRVTDNAGGDYTKFIENITERNPGFAFAYDSDGTPTLESIAYAIRAEEDRIKRESTNALLV